MSHDCCNLAVGVRATARIRPWQIDMLSANLRSIVPFALGLSLLPLLSGCQTTKPRPTSSTSVPRQKITAPADPAASKQFATVTDWSNGIWVIKKGATIAFRRDGIGSFSARVYTVQSARRQELQFQSVQYGKDGNELFLAPAADLGYAIHARNPNRDYPVDLNFGFDARQFPEIDRVTYVSRIREADATTAKRSERSASSGKSF